MVVYSHTALRCVSANIVVAWYYYYPVPIAVKKPICKSW